ncbi:MAG: WD40 repeat domain-containing protein [Anaerolineae bacterium]|nr:WD40 repeat domain-containing protein [Anaerolineae bacterium]
MYFRDVFRLSMGFILTVGLTSCKIVTENPPSITVSNALQLESIATLKGRPESQVNTIAFSPDSTLLAVGKGGYNDAYTDNNVVEIWNIENLNLMTVLPGHTLPVTDVEFSPDGTVLASGAGYPDGGANNDTVRVWNPQTGVQLITLPGNTMPFQSLDFEPDGTHIAYNQEEVSLGNIQTGEVDIKFEVEGWYADKVVFSPDGNLLAASIYDRPGAISTQIWEVETCQQMATLETPGVSTLAFGPESDLLVTASIDYKVGKIRVQYWSTRTFTETARFELDGNYVHRVSFSPDGAILAVVASDGYHDPGNLYLWNSVTRERLATLGNQDIRVMAFSPDGIVLATGQVDGSVRLWEVSP